MLFERLILHDDRARASAALNMAIDEGVARACHAAHPALLRLAPAVAFLRLLWEIRRHRRRNGTRDVVRRWTGGGSVLHGEDLTYSLVTPATDPASSHGPAAIYAALHGAIRDALRAEGSEAELAAQAAPKISDACFANPVRDDVMLRGRKIAGAAQRRTRGGFLHQAASKFPTSPHPFASDLPPGLPTKSSGRKSRRRVPRNGPPNWRRKNTATVGMVAPLVKLPPRRALTLKADLLSARV